MTFSRKIFVSVFVTALVLGSAIIWTSHRYMSRQTEEKFVSRYSVFTRVLSHTLTRLDTNTEALMLNAVKVVAERDAAGGLLSTEKLKSMREELSVTHIFVVNKDGKFIRSTNEDPSLIPNAYSFCPEYRNMALGKSDVEATPIIHPSPEPKPYKFLFVPSLDRQRLLEVGVRVDFIAKTLSEALGSDENIESMSLYDPHGTIFGRFSSKEVDFKSGTVELPAEFPRATEDSEYYHFFTKVTSSHPKCCQCDVSKTSKNGEYYYVLEAKVSKGELKALQANAGLTFLLLGFGNGILSWILARLLSRRLVRNIERAVERVRKIKDRGDVTNRIGMETGDEISFLTQEFDRLLDSLEDSQQKLVEAEKVQSKVELARVVAHNIRSPILAIEMMLPGLVSLPDRMKRVLKNSVKEIKQLAEKLKTQSDSMISENHMEMDTDLVFLPIFMTDLIAQKRLEFSETDSNRFNFEQPTQKDGFFVKVSSVELKSVISNIINNARESYGNIGGDVRITLETIGLFSCIKVQDRGAGIPPEYLSSLGSKAISFKGDRSRGLGLVHAFKTVEAWGGRIEIESELGVGTSVVIMLPRYMSDETGSVSGASEHSLRFKDPGAPA